MIATHGVMARRIDEKHRIQLSQNTMILARTPKLQRLAPSPHSAFLQTHPERRLRAPIRGTMRQLRQHYPFRTQPMPRLS